MLMPSEYNPASITQPPQDIDAENQFLAAVFVIGVKALDDVANILQPSDFYQTPHSLIFKAILALKAKGAVVDLVTVANQLKETGELKKAGGPSMLNKIADEVPISLNPSGHAEIIKNCALKRELAALGARLAHEAGSGKSVQELLSLIQKKTNNLSQNSIKTPFVFQPKTITADFDPAGLPEREWIVLNSILKGHVSAIVGPGGVCKSIYTMVMCILVAARGTRSETDLTGPVQRYAKTLVINNEDDQVEMERRIAGVLLAYGIHPSELEGQFFYESGYGARRLICDETTDGEVIRAPFVDRLVQYIKEQGIALVVIDPFVSSHRSNENDNSKIDDVVSIYKYVAAVTGCAIVLVHHTRKGSADDAPTIEASRGGKALTDGCRAGVIIMPLPQSDKKLFGLSDDEARDIVRMDSGKSNYSRKGAGVYFKLESVKLPNGDWVGVPRRIELEEKAHDKGNRVVEISQFMAMALTAKAGPDGGSLPWSELRGLYMSLADVKSTVANQDVTLLPKGRGKALKVSFYDDKGQYVFCQVWYEKGEWRTAPIVVHMEPQKNGQENVADEDLFTEK